MNADVEDDDLDWMEEDPKPRIIRKIVIPKPKQRNTFVPKSSIRSVGASLEAEASRDASSNEKARSPQVGEEPRSEAPQRNHVAHVPVRSLDRDGSKLKMYSDELQRIGALRANDLDAQVRLPFVMIHVGMSRAKIYRRIDEGNFPQQIKHGRSSFWRFSEIEHVRVHGVWPPSCTQSPFASGD